ncbi:bifunctional isocitrate dehydrogenase kinase/phosphatase [Erwinia sp. OAMSP11]|uniref:bifunctional isocitrate dehydrogenase kinase/phosphatase n=1 Tax=Erwinia sp. OAMSP11 TaxID=1933285 RepID=UPI000C197548|nr:bifunctional isocitrate dehydrogenase kinase/phosphatase [Erwinia sp. OAMSP11]PIJ48437.1 bifunctional isocitrate dehydrogenase kinase/phosphatase [Erwinia sp. OAMSP11]
MPPFDLLIAQTILQGFDAQYGRFLEITAGAQQRFEQADWQGIQQAMKSRIHLYDHHVGLVTTQLRCIARQQRLDETVMQRVKQLYTTLLPDYPRFEIAESFYNSVYCRLFGNQAMTDDRLFIFSSQPERRFCNQSRPLSKCWQAGGDLLAMLSRIVDDLPLRLPWQNKARDIDCVNAHLQENFPAHELAQARLEVFNELFYRNKAAWLVAKLHLASGSFVFLLPIHRTEQGELFIDTCLTRRREASIVFGFARAYFMVYAPEPAALVDWLRDILPGKTTAELYMAIGCQKHGKTESHREYLRYLSSSDDPFIPAPGVPGMVMLVFTLAGFDRVFKVIKDRFAPQKEVTEAQVRERYQQVKEHDRVGRMADTQEFEFFALERSRISPQLMALMQRDIADKMRFCGRWLIIHHLYIERKMIPLNLWLEQADDRQRHDAIEEYGNAIKQLAAADIFPGDMLFKNFGVTRHGRVVFYDYDEISTMTGLQFRQVPAARYPEDELSAEPWYSVAADDVFPETFRHYLCADKRLVGLLETLHPELFDPHWWQHIQQRLRQGYIEDVYAYRRRQRFCNRQTLFAS